MLIGEMHIALDQELDSINVRLEDNLLAEQKDFFINREIKQFVKNKIRAIPNTNDVGLDEVIKRLHDVQNLVEYDFPIIVNNTSEGVEGTLPPSCYYLIKGNTTVSCNTTIASSNLNVKHSIIPFKVDTDNFENFVISYFKTAVETILFDLSDYSTLNTGTITIDDYYLVHDLFMTEINKRSDVKIYWQYYKGEFYSNSYILVTTDSDITSFAFKYDNAVNNQVINTTLNSYPYFTGGADFEKVECRTTSLESIVRRKRSSFFKSVASSPLLTLNKRHIKAYNDKNFILSSLYLTFVRQPQIVSLSLGKSCDLDELIHDEIIRLTARSIKAIIGSSNYQASINETNLIE